MKYRSFLVVSSLALALMPAGCGVNANPRPSSQLAAKVNGTEITVQQVGGARQGNRLQALDKIIDRELLVQKALEAKLDADPEVAQSIDSARRQLLAQAYLERTAAAKAKTSP